MAKNTQVLDETGDINLFSVFVPDIPKDVIFPTEVNTYLKHQLVVSIKLMVLKGITCDTNNYNFFFPSMYN